MKTYIIIPLIAFLLASCAKVDKLGQFTIPYKVDVTIPANDTSGVSIDIMTPEIPTGIGELLKTYNTSTEKIEKVALRDMEIYVNSPATGDLGFLNSIEIFIRSTGKESYLAGKKDIGTSVGGNLVLEISDNDVKDFIFNENFSIRVKAVSDENIPQDHDCTVSFVFFVDYRLLGQ